MSRKILGIAVGLLAMIGVQFGAMAADNGTPDEAKAMVEKAVALIQAEGKDNAFKKIDDKSGSFVDRDLYVFVISLESGNTVAHGTNKALIGKNLTKVKDADGKLFVNEMLELGKTAGQGWVDYKWANPVTKKIEAKSSYIRKVGDVIVGVGVYKG